MTATQECPKCGSPLLADAPRGLCVECLMRLVENPFSVAPAAVAGTPGGDADEVRFGDYDLLQQIGRGGMGVVYEARQISLNRIVALKMILGSDLRSSSAGRRFQIEAEAAAKLNHPNIVAIHEFGEHEGLNYFSMQRIEGTGLDQQMGALALPSMGGLVGESSANKSAARQAQERVARLVAVLARALHYAHEQGVIHCDVKPSNILLDRRGEPHLTDFGIARILDYDGQLTKTGVMGTPRYMSPEQATGKRGEMGATTDIFSVGVILYELLTGRAPFRAATPHETFQQVMEREPVAPHEVHPLVHRDLSIICLKCLEKEPRHRYGSAAELADDLERWLHREPILARRANLPERLYRWSQRKPVVAALTASVGFLLVAIAITSTLFALHLSDKEKQREAAARVLRAELNQTLDQLWEHPGTPSVTISSTKRMVLNGEMPRSEAEARRLLPVKFGVYTFLGPSEMARRFTPLLTSLEKHMTERMGRPVGIDFTIYRTYTLGSAGLLSGEVDFMRVGPSSYVHMKERDPGVSLLVAQENLIRCTIFTRKDSGINSLGELRGKAFAFGDPESTFGTYMAKYALLQAGLRVEDLGAGSRHCPSHDNVAKTVESGECAAGSANIVAYDSGVFKELHRFVNELRMPFVAQSGLDPMVARALKSAMLAERSPSVLTNLPGSPTGFCEVTDQEYDELRENMKQAEAFGDLRP